MHENMYAHMHAQMYACMCKFMYMNMIEYVYTHTLLSLLCIRPSLGCKGRQTLARNAWGTYFLRHDRQNISQSCHGVPTWFYCNMQQNTFLIVGELALGAEFRVAWGRLLGSFGWNSL